MEREVNKLKRSIFKISTLIEESFQKALIALKRKDSVLAGEVQLRDREVDRYEVLAEEEGFTILALHQPVATDLRYLIGLLKINHDLEKIGDLAKDIASCVIVMAQFPAMNPIIELDTMSEKVNWMVKSSLDALAHLDTNLAHQVCKMDDAVDLIDHQNHQKITQSCKQMSENVEVFFELFIVSSSLEQIADHAKKIAENVIYITQGEIIRHQ